MTGMDLQRFQALVDAYGGDLARWPEPERAGATALLKSNPRASALLAEAAVLDEALDGWRLEPAGFGLRDRVAAGAPVAGRIRLLSPRNGQALRLWLAGAGLAAGLSGVSCGVILSTLAVREARDEALVAAAYHDSSTALSSFSEPVRIL